MSSAFGPGWQAPTARRRALTRRASVVAGALLLVACVVVAVVLTRGEEVRPFAYAAGAQAAFEQRGAAGESYLLYANSPGGALATARRVAALRVPIASAAASAHVNPELVEGIVFLESGGLSDAIAGGDPGAAAGVSQILPQTGRGLLGLRIDLAASRRLTRQIASARRRRQTTSVAALERERRRVDQRFDPVAALAATGRYLTLALAKFGRSDFAVASYHMGIGNLANVIRAYAGPSEKRLAVHVVADRKLTYAQLYFDSSPFHHAAAYRLLAGFGDNSDTYYWRVLAARDIMSLYRANPQELRRREQLETSHGSAEAVLHPPGSTEVFADAAALKRAVSAGRLLAVPDQPSKRHFAVDPAIGAHTHPLGHDPSLYRSLRPEALAVLYYIADRVHTIAGGQDPLLVVAAARDSAEQNALVTQHLQAAGYSLYTTGYSFDIARRYGTHAQAEAFQALLNRLQALNVLAWQRRGGVIHITASAAVSELTPILHGASLTPDA